MSCVAKVVRIYGNRRVINFTTYAAFLSKYIVQLFLLSGLLTGPIGSWYHSDVQTSPVLTYRYRLSNHCGLPCTRHNALFNMK